MGGGRGERLDHGGSARSVNDGGCVHHVHGVGRHGGAQRVKEK